MNVERRLIVSWPVALMSAAALVTGGAGAAYLWVRSSSPSMTIPAEALPRVLQQQHPSGPAGPVAAGPLPDVTVTLTADAVERAGIVVTPVRSRGATASLRLPGVVQPNAYRQVTVTPLVSGRITRVLVGLGAHVRRGQPMAEVFSPELAEVQTRYLTMRAELDAAHQELRRTQQLVGIGAASQQELEQARARHTTHATDVEGARSRLRLLGMAPDAIAALTNASAISASTSVPAPIDGVVTERTANPGLNVEASAMLFTVVDLSTVWVIADVYEKDFSRVRVGGRAQVTTAAYPDLVLHGRVSYIDPQVNPDTRTAKARVEVPNPRGDLRLGMYAHVQVSADSPAPVAVVPRGAVQNVGDRHVVYVADSRKVGVFTEREVRLAATAGDEVEVLTGVQAGDIVVAEGSFYVRAERERLGLRVGAGAAGPAAGSPASAPPERQAADVIVGAQGFEPARLSLKAGVPARITFRRTSDKTCATAVEIPELSVRRDLPLNQPVAIDVTPEAGELRFSCGMNMLRGTIVAQ